MDNNPHQAESHSVSIIIPTMCQAARAALLMRAIQSVVTQAGVSVEILVVINGDKCDADLATRLEHDARLRVIRLNDANVSIARHEGVRQAKGDFFCFLDDDDEFLPGGLFCRASILVQNELIDVAVTNGYEHCAGEDLPLVKQGIAESITSDPGVSFFHGNWFASPASLFRAKTIGSELFDFSFKYFEWTYLFFLLLSRGKRFHYVETLTYRKYEDNPLSISKSIEYTIAYPDFLQSLAQLPVGPDIKRLIRKRYVTALNTQSGIELKQGCWTRAWKTHIKCLINGGWQYLPYTRHLLIPRLSDK